MRDKDPLLFLPMEIMFNVISFLPPQDVLKCSYVSSAWSELANADCIWASFCDRLWSDKIYVPAQYQRQKNDEPKSAYFLSLRDSKRTYITAEELMEFVWNFRFKESAGEHWIAHDPWWRDQRAARVRFLLDGCVSMDGWPATVDDASGRQLERRWKFIPATAGRKGPLGSFLQINNFPPLIVSRYKNWGFLLQSCWVFYTSFPMPPPGVCLELEEASLEVTTDTMKQEAMRYNIGVEFNLHDHTQILDLLQLLAQIHHPQHGFTVNLGADDDDSDDDRYDGNDNNDNDNDNDDNNNDNDLNDNVDNNDESAGDNDDDGDNDVDLDNDTTRDIIDNDDSYCNNSNNSRENVETQDIGSLVVEADSDMAEG